MEPNSFADQLSGAMNNSTGTGSAPQKGQLVAKSIMELLKENTGGDQGKALQLLEKALYPKLKNIGTTDITNFRVICLSDRVVDQRNDQTYFMDFMNARNGSVDLTDYQYKIVERSIGSQYSAPFNMDAALPAAVQSTNKVRFNTATALGDTIMISFMAQNIASMQGNPGGTKLFEDEVDFEITRIRKQMNKMLMSNTEVVSEALGQVPQLGGFFTRSVTAPISAAGGNLTNGLLTSASEQIRALYGNVQVALFVTAGQLAIIRDLMINRFPGSTSVDHLNYMRQLFGEAGMAADSALYTQVVYQPYPGKVIPVYYDPDIPANTGIMFRMDLPRIARMKFNGQVGPHLLARPEATLYDRALVFDLFSLDDPKTDSRVLLQNLAS